MQETVEDQHVAGHLEEVGDALDARARRGFGLVGELAVRAAVEPVDDHAEVQPGKEADQVMTVSAIIR